MLTNVTIDRPEPHCILWVPCLAVLFGMSRESDLDEPVPMSNFHEVRARLSKAGNVVLDRSVNLIANASGRNVMLRLIFVSGKFFETEISDVEVSILNNETVNVC